MISYAFVAQQVERTAVNRDVGGSSPPESVAFLTEYRTGGSTKYDSTRSAWPRFPPILPLLFLSITLFKMNSFIFDEI